MLEQKINNPEVEGSIPAGAATGRDKMPEPNKKSFGKLFQF
jgi:hypothetical protein